jgi:hypothetical protein
MNHNVRSEVDLQKIVNEYGLGGVRNVGKVGGKFKLDCPTISCGLS